MTAKPHALHAGPRPGFQKISPTTLHGEGRSPYTQALRTVPLNAEPAAVKPSSRPRQRREAKMAMVMPNPTRRTGRQRAVNRHSVPRHHLTGTRWANQPQSPGQGSGRQRLSPNPRIKRPTISSANFTGAETGNSAAEPAAPASPQANIPCNADRLAPY